MLGGIVVLLVVLLAAPIQRLLASRSAVASAATQLRTDRAELARLQHQQQLWSDPGYVEQQARTRLLFAMPGDTVYTVVRAGQRSQLAVTSGARPRPANGPGWNTRLWQSVRAAGG